MNNLTFSYLAFSRARWYTLLALFLMASSMTFAQADLTIDAEIEIDDNGTYDFLIPANLDTLVYPQITFSLRGADGGRARYERTFDSNPKIGGGRGAIGQVSFGLGSGTEKLSPGGTIRFIVGKRGENCSSRIRCGAGGGGGTAILYLHPGAVISPSVDTASLAFTDAITGTDPRPTGWILLAVTGGGSGAVVTREDQVSGYEFFTGGSGTSGTQGGNGGPNGENAGGMDGADGEDGDNANGGTGFRSAGWEEQPDDNTYEHTGGSGYGRGGSAKELKAVSGGGGGFSGGVAGENAVSGGGGGSFLNSAGLEGSLVSNGTTRFPDDGRVSYRFILDGTPGDAPIASCVDNFTVTLTGGEDVTLTPADLDNGSSDPAGFDLTYQMCQTADGTEYFCRESKTWDCGDVGKNQPWFLAVSNGYQTIYCGMTISIDEERAEPTCPLSGRTIYNLDGSCTQALTASELAHLNTLDCEDNFPDVTLLLPDDSSVGAPDDFFSAGYIFEDGTTTLIYETEGGQCALAIEVNADPSPFPLDCPDSQTILLGAGECETTISATNLALNYNGPGAISYHIEPEVATPIVEGNGHLPQTTFSRGSNAVTYMVVEPGGCETSCSFAVSVDYTSDNAIDFACQDVTIPYSVALDARETVQAGVLRAEDNCGPVPIELTVGYLTGCVAAGTTQQVSVRVGNGAFEQNCTFNLTLTEPDYTPTCSSQFLSAILDDSGELELTPEMLANWTDSDDIMASVDVISVDCSNVGSTINVTVTLTDQCGNTDSCIRQVRANDRARPTITCQNISRGLDSNGEAIISYGDLVTTANDNCGIDDLTFTLSQSFFTCSDRGNTTIFVTAEDENSNRGLCSSTITITDDTPPSLTCKDATIELAEDGTYRLAVDDVVASFSDNCTGGFSYSQRNFSCDDVANSPISINVRYRDVGNNTTVCNSLITIVEPECPCLGSDGILVVDNPEDVILCEDMTVEGVRFVEGNLFLNGYTLTVENTGRIQNEGESKFTDGGAGGKIRAINVAEFQDDLMTEIGLTLSNLSDDIRLERLERSGQAVEIDGFPSINRVITVEESFSPPSDNARFHYLDAELNGIDEDNLGLYLEQNGMWESVSILNRSTIDNYVEFALDFSQLADPVLFTLAPSAALPIDLLTFTGETQDKVNQLKWTTAQEEAFSHFIIERSAEGAVWQNLGAVAGAGEALETNVTYSFTDVDPLKENYYRLKIFDLDSSFAYSPVVKLDNRSTVVELTVSPNPSNGHFRVALTGVDGPFNLALYTIHGTCVSAQKALAGTLNWEPEGKLPLGVYLLVATSKEGRWTKQIFIR